MATCMVPHPDFLPLQLPSVNTVCLFQEAFAELSLLGHLGWLSSPRVGQGNALVKPLKVPDTSLVQA